MPLNVVGGTEVAFWSSANTRSTGYYGQTDNGMSSPGGSDPIQYTARFGWEAYIPYEIDGAGGLVLAFTVLLHNGEPSGATGNWGVHGALQGFVPGYGTDLAAVVGAHDSESWLHARGYFDITGATDTVPLRLWYGRLNDSGTVTLKAGTWIKVTRLS